MKIIGLIGGMSWESSQYYYRIINETVRRRLGGLHSAECIMYSVDFALIERLQMEGQWQEAGEVLAGIAERLERGGADFIVLCTNTMHRVAAAIEQRVRLPLLHIADPTADAIRRAGLRRVGLLGTRFTMEQEFYKSRLIAQHGLEVMVPTREERQVVHRIIYEELCLGHVRDASRDEYLSIIEHMIRAGAEGVILGCTEIMLLIRQEQVRVPIFDTTTLHAVAAVERALA